MAPARSHPPSSRGKSSQRMPVLSTKRMPVSALRLSIGFRPGKRNRRGFGGGNNGSIRFQSSSGSRGLAISNLLRMVYLYYVEDTCQVRHFVSVSKEIPGRTSGELHRRIRPNEL